MDSQDDTSVAIVGMSFRFGGDATCEEEFWNMLVQGKCARSSVPADRYNAASFYHPDITRSDGSLPTNEGIFLKEDIAAFDAPFFGIKPAEAEAMDPQSRKLLQAAYLAFENAGISMDRCKGTRTCVFTGISSNDYHLMYAKDPSHPTRYAATGLAPAMLANKISWFFDLKGPSVQLDTACSSSLSAVHMACRSLQSGESNLGIVGGANLFVTPDSLMPLAQMGFLSPDARCYSFDSRANGYCRGDGYGVFILKRLRDALLDGDPIRAVIKSTSMNENGRVDGGITQVDFHAQTQLIHSAYGLDGPDPSLTRFVEAHGPGTPGDIVEAAAIASVFKEYRSDSSPLYLGSAKANIGHLEGSSGIASLVKVVLMLEKGIIPKLANLEIVHPLIADHERRLNFPRDNLKWPDGLRQASINSFGFGGANAHAVVQDAETYQEHQEIQSWPPRKLLLVWSAPDEQSLKRIVEQYRVHRFYGTSLEHQAAMDLSYTLACRRQQFIWKSWLVLSPDGTHYRMELDSISKPRRSESSIPLVFLFTGQGSYWPRMGSQFLTNKVFRATLQRLDRCLQSIGASWTIIDTLSQQRQSHQDAGAVITQTLTTAIQLALVDMLSDLGLRPTNVIGHSSGEIAAAYASGALDLETACTIAYYRGWLISQEFVTEDHGMLVVSLTGEELGARLANTCFKEEPIYIACLNSSHSITVSGKIKAIESLEKSLQGEKVLTKRLKIPYPYHSPFLAPVSTKYRAILDARLQGRATSILSVSATMQSTVTTDVIASEELNTAEYWSQNLVQVVKFETALHNLLERLRQDNDYRNLRATIVEIGPCDTLRGAVRDIISMMDKTDSIVDVDYCAVLRRGELSDDRLFETMGSLHAAGHSVNIQRLNCVDTASSRCLQDLPEYPFDATKTYWHENEISRSYRFQRFPRHDLLGTRSLDWNPLTPQWQNRIVLSESPWIKDHLISDRLIYPAAAMLAAVIESAMQYVSEIEQRTIKTYLFKDVEFVSALVMDEPETAVKLCLNPSHDTIGKIDIDTRFTFKLFATPSGAQSKMQTEICCGEIRVGFTSKQISIVSPQPDEGMIKTDLANMDWVLKHCEMPMPKSLLYARLRNLGLNFGRSFQVLDDIRTSSSRDFASASIELDKWRSADQAESKYLIHPTALDGTFSLAIVALGGAKLTDLPTMLPRQIASLWISAEGLEDSKDLIAVSWSKRWGLRHMLSSVVGCNRVENPCIVMEGLQCTTIRKQNSTSVDAVTRKTPSLFHLEWRDLVPQPATDLEEMAQRGRNQSSRTFILTTSKSPLVGQIVECLKEKWSSVAGVVHFEDLPFLNHLDRADRSTVVFHEQDTLVVLFEPHTEISDCKIFLIVKAILHRTKHVVWVTLPPYQNFSPGVSPAADHGIVTGLSRVLRTEYQFNLSFITLDATEMSVTSTERLCESIGNLQHADTMMSSEPDCIEFEFRFVGDGPGLQAPRLVETTFNPCLTVDERTTRPFHAGSKDLPDLKVEVRQPGLLDSLTFVETERDMQSLLPTEILVRPRFVGLNYLDVLTALGEIPNNADLGMEAAGVVVGAGVQTDLEPGMNVVLLTDGALRSTIRVDYRCAFRLSDKISLRDAASLFATACTAYQALMNLARIGKGQHILVHAAAGATGQMAIQIAQSRGAIVIATVGAESKRELLHAVYGIPQDYIFSDRNTEFIPNIQKITNGKGVDVVLNSLKGALLEDAWTQIMSPGGHWIELGKKDILNNSKLPMKGFASNISFHGVDLAEIWRRRPAMMRGLLQDVSALVEEGILTVPQPITEFGIDRMRDAFRVIRSNIHGGKVLINMGPETIVEARKIANPSWTFRDDRSYLIVGGLGGLGIEIAEWMVKRGARSLILLSRTGSSDDHIRARIRRLRVQGCDLFTDVCNIADEDTLRLVIDRHSASSPIAGCIHAGMALSDARFEDMTATAWNECTDPKIEGSRNLDELLPSGLDFFIFLSSLNGIIGAFGQSNYAAGNAYQDSLARARIIRGGKAVSLDLGMITDAGAIARDESLARVMQGVGYYQSMTVGDIIRLLEHYCNPELPLKTEKDSHLICGLRSPSAIISRGHAKPFWSRSALFSRMGATGQDEASDDLLSSQLDTMVISLRQTASRSEAIALMENHVQDKLRTILTGSITEFDLNRPLSLYGVDSLIARELNNWMMITMQVDIDILNMNGGIRNLATLLVEQSPTTSHLKQHYQLQS